MLAEISISGRGARHNAAAEPCDISSEKSVEAEQLHSAGFCFIRNLHTQLQYVNFCEFQTNIKGPYTAKDLLTMYLIRSSACLIQPNPDCGGLTEFGLVGR